MDNKGPILSCLYALYTIKLLQIELKKQVCIIFGCEEESGFEVLEYDLKHERPPITGWMLYCKYPVVMGKVEELLLTSQLMKKY